MLPVFEFFFIINRSMSARPGLPVTQGMWMMSRLPCLYPVYCNHHNLCLEPVEWFLHQQIRVIHFIFSVHFPFLVVLNKRKNKCMGNCLSKFNDKSFTLHTPPLTSGNIKKLISGMRKSTVKYFATGVHQKYGYERITQSIKSSLRIHMTDFLHNLLRY